MRLYKLLAILVIAFTVANSANAQCVGGNCEYSMFPVRRQFSQTSLFPVYTQPARYYAPSYSMPLYSAPTYYYQPAYAPVRLRFFGGGRCVGGRCGY